MTIQLQDLLDLCTGNPTTCWIHVLATHLPAGPAYITTQLQNLLDPCSCYPTTCWTCVIDDPTARSAGHVYLTVQLQVCWTCVLGDPSASLLDLCTWRPVCKSAGPVYLATQLQVCWTCVLGDPTTRTSGHVYLTIHLQDVSDLCT